MCRVIVWENGNVMWNVINIPLNTDATKNFIKVLYPAILQNFVYDWNSFLMIIWSSLKD